MNDTEKKMEETKNDQIRELSLTEVETVGGGQPSCPAGTHYKDLGNGWYTCVA